MHRNSSVTLALVVLLVGMVAAGAASVQPARAASAGVDIKDLAYSPATVQVTPGDSVTWTNSEEIMPHDVTSGTLGQPDLGQLFGSGMLLPGQSFTATFPDPGEFVYVCNLHPAMIGVVIVQPS
jgi:plastocyanin